MPKAQMMVPSLRVCHVQRREKTLQNPVMREVFTEELKCKKDAER